jgi:hypothetical protein
LSQRYPEDGWRVSWDVHDDHIDLRIANADGSIGWTDHLAPSGLDSTSAWETQAERIVNRFILGVDLGPREPATHATYLVQAERLAGDLVVVLNQAMSAVPSSSPLDYAIRAHTMTAIKLAHALEQQVRQLRAEVRA